MLIYLLFQKFIVNIMNNFRPKVGCHISSNNRDKQGAESAPPPKALSVSNNQGQVGLILFNWFNDLIEFTPVLIYIFHFFTKSKVLRPLNTLPFL